MRVRLPQDPTKRRFVIGLGCSLALHLLLVLAMFLGRGGFGPQVYVKRGEPLLVDIAPDRPEPAPLGRPDRPVGPPERQEPQRRPAQQPSKPTPAAKPTPQPSQPSQPRVAVEPQKPARARQSVEPKPPAPPQQVAKAPAPESPPAASAPAPQPAQATPAPKPPEPAQTAQRPSERSAEPQRPSEASPQGGRQPEVSDPRYALTKPSLDTPPSIFSRRPGGGGGIRGGGRGGVEGEPIPLDTPDPKYQDYFNQVRERIKAKWIYPHEAGERGIGGNLMIEFHIGKDGRLSHLELRRSSGVEILDDYALRAIQLAQPFPPVPDVLAKNVLAISGLFTYQIIGNSFVNQYLR
jgi:periplasmic protein TonB